MADPALTSLPLWADAAVATLLVTGAAFALIGSWGLAKMSDFYKRIHGPTKATTLGVGGVLLASSLFFTVREGSLSVTEFLITLFVLLTAPVSAHLMVKAAMHLDRIKRRAHPVSADSRSAGSEVESRFRSS